MTVLNETKVWSSKLPMKEYVHHNVSIEFSPTIAL